MIKFVATAKGGFDLPPGAKAFGFGLSAENVRRLRQGQPIKVNLQEMVPELEGWTLVIFYGETEADMKAELAPYLGPETKEHYGP